MRTRGVKLLDPVLDTLQIDWLLLPVNECPGPEDEWQVISSHFRKPHEPWGPSRAFVLPVSIRRSRRRVLFSQQSGLQQSGLE